MIRKRIIAYGIDIILITLLTSFIFTIFSTLTTPEKYLETYENYMNITNKYIEDEATEEEVIEAEYNMVKSSSNLMIIKVGLTLFYFSIIPYFTKGQTIGKKITKIRIVPNTGKELKPNSVFFRGIINSLVFIDIINLLILFLCKQSTWYNLTFFTSALSYTMYLIFMEFIIFRKDKRSLHDVLTNTKVIEIN